LLGLHSSSPSLKGRRARWPLFRGRPIPGRGLRGPPS
jgi:hypothetical protein